MKNIKYEKIQELEDFKMNNKNRNLVLNGLFIALVYVATRFINIPGPSSGGLFHLGNVMAFTIAIVFGRKAGAISGGIGMMLFDLTSSYFVWAPFTLIIRFSMGYIIGISSEKFVKNRTYNIISILVGIILSGIIMVSGYYVAEVILYHNFITPVQSIIANLNQVIIGAVIGIPLSLTLKESLKRANFNIYLENKTI